ncbi:MAG: prepilin peptidase [Candidatus Doudnabacteria bacterium]|nr:prepilin peptidase [Candidatus Doudnabacteria bacterium]
MDILAKILVFIFGLCIGSFLNVVIWRLPKDKSITGRSNCAFCGHVLSVGDLVPVLSYLGLGGKCRYCHKKISPRYLIIELATGLAYLLAFTSFMPSDLVSGLLFLKVLVGISILVSVFVIDLENFLILDSVIFFGFAVSLVLNLVLDRLSGDWGSGSLLIQGLLGALAASLPFFLIWYFSRGRMMGFGDVKLALFMGMLLGLKGVLVGLYVGIIIGGICGVCLLLFAGKNLKTKLPFGTFLSVGAFIALFWGEKMFNWYLGLLGF